MAWRRSISAQSAGAEQTISVPVSFSTQRNAGMSSFEPSRMPACEAPVCDERSVSHSANLCDPSSSHRAMLGALPSRMARCSTGRASPSISRKTMPGVSARTRSPERRAIRCVTRNVYVSSSLVPNRTSRATPSAAATRATPSADQKESTDRAPLVTRSAPSSISASSTSTRTNPSTSMNGSRSAATTGGRRAFRIAMTAVATRAPQKSVTWAPGTIQAAPNSAAVDSSQASNTPTGRMGGLAGLQVGTSP